MPRVITSLPHTQLPYPGTTTDVAVDLDLECKIHCYHIQ